MKKKFFRVSYSSRVVGSDPTQVNTIEFTAGPISKRRWSIRASECWGSVEVRGYFMFLRRARQIHFVVSGESLIGRIHEALMNRHLNKQEDRYDDAIKGWK